MQTIKDVIYRIKPDADMLIVDFVDYYVGNYYSEFFRDYHNGENHIYPMLEVFDDEIRKLCKDPDIVEFAWWYHDLIYVPGSPNCEEVSAARARYDALQLGFEEGKANLIQYLVLATDHSKDIKNIHLNDEKIIHDLDLVIFASEHERYDEYVKQIRKEYFFVLEYEFAKGRLKILENIIERDYIFYHEYFRKKYEKKARNNLKNEIEFLKNRIEP